jgi:hypothetical protein
MSWTTTVVLSILICPTTYSLLYYSIYFDFVYIFTTTTTGWRWSTGFNLHQIWNLKKLHNTYISWPYNILCTFKKNNSFEPALNYCLMKVKKEWIRTSDEAIQLHPFKSFKKELVLFVQFVRKRTSRKVQCAQKNCSIRLIRSKKKKKISYIHSVRAKKNCSIAQFVEQTFSNSSSVPSET